MNPPPRGDLTTGVTWAYAGGELGANLTWNMVSGFILFYYTNVALLPAAAAGTLLLLTRVLDAIVDPAMGLVVDATRTRFGRARPWLIGASLPMVVLTTLSFSIPPWSQTAKILWAAISFTLAGFVYSAWYIPYGALLPLMTSNPVDKLRVGSLRSMAASAGSILVYGGTLFLVRRLGGDNPRLGFTLTAAVMSLGAALCMLVVFLTCRERSRGPVAAMRAKLAPTLAAMWANPVWRVISSFALIMFIRLGALVSVTAYFAADLLDRPMAAGLLLSSLSFSLLLGGVLARPWLRRLGKRWGNIVALSVAIVLAPAMWLARDHWPIFGALYMVSNVTFGIQSTTIFIGIADAVDAQEARFGHRGEGLMTASVSFAIKVGMAAGGALIAFGLALVHYDPHHVTVAARNMIGALYFVVSPSLALLQIAIIACYRFEPERLSA